MTYVSTREILEAITDRQMATLEQTEREMLIFEDEAWPVTFDPETGRLVRPARN
jgi:hypothetical protein